MPEPLLVIAPDAGAALALVQELDDLDAVAEGEGGRWEVRVPLDGATAGTVPAVLATVRSWLARHGLDSTGVRLDGHLHLIRAERTLQRG